MEANDKVKVYNSTLGLKGVEGTFISVSSDGYYELYMKFNDKRHKILLPINNTVLVSDDAVVDGERFTEDIIR
jgi:hypothetical protein